MPRFEMTMFSQDYYSREGSWVFKLPQTITNRDDANKWVKDHLKEILEPTAGNGTWISKTHFRFDRGQCEGNATYEVSVHPIPDDEERWEEFVLKWNEAHPYNRPDNWSGVW